LDPSKLRWKPGASACVVLTSGGYPGKFENGKRIDGLTTIERITGVKVLHAGTKLAGETVFTNGGRVLGVTAAATSIEAALASAYEAVSKIHFEGMHYRKDIGAHATQLKVAGD
jgi:phosphoribosylamine--glycine ligase